MLKKLLLPVMFSTLIIGGLSAQVKLLEKVTKKGNEIVIPYEKYLLPNGLTVIVHEDHSDPVVHVDVTYHVGSAREQINKSGFAHFFEHMMFQGSDNVADEQHFKIVTEAGGTLNGSTNRDRTNYYETVPSNQLEKALWLEADRMGFLLDAVTQKKFEIQRSTVKNERGQNYDNRPYGLVFENLGKNLYPYGHSYSWSTIGYLEDLNRSNVNDLKNFFLRWYGPNNATVTVGGDVKPADVLKLVTKYFGSIPRGPEVSNMTATPVQLTSTRYVSYVDNYAKLPLLAIVYPTVPNYHEDMAALQCLAQILGQGRNSILFQNMVKPQLALQASASSQLSELAGEFGFQIIPSGTGTLADMEKLLQTALTTFEKRGVTDDDLAKFKGGIEAQQINGLQSVSGKVSQLAAFQTFTGNPNKISELLKMYASLTKEDVMNAYNTYIKNKPSVILSVATKDQEDNIVAANNYTIDTKNYTAPDYGYESLKYVKAKDNFNRSKLPGNGPNPMVKVPKFWKQNLANGIKVIGAQTTEIPTVTFSLTVPGGHLTSANNLSKIGLPELFASMMSEDTKNYTAEQIALELQKLGSSLNVSNSVDGTVFTVNSLKKNFDKTLALLKERLFNPKFTEASFDRIKKQTLQSFKQQKSQPSVVADIVFAKLNYGPNHILGMDEGGTEATIKNITLQDIEIYYNAYLTSQGAKVVVVGDITKAEVLPKLTFLDKLPRKKVTLEKITAAPGINNTKIYLVNVPKAAQTEFRVGNATGLKYDATGDYYKSYLMNWPLGGSFNSRLNINLREDKGWTYGARSGFSGDEYSGGYEFSSGIRADATDSALTEVLTELKNYLQNGPKDDELIFMKSAIGQSDALRYETGPQKAQFIRRILQYNLPPNYVELQSGILKGMTKAQMQSYAKKYINPDKMNILLVGDKKVILPGLQKMGYEIIELDTDGNVIK